MTDQLYEKIVAVMCKHLPSLGGNHLTVADIWSKRQKEAIFGATGSKRGHFASENIETPIDFNLLDTESSPFFAPHKEFREDQPSKLMQLFDVD